MIRDRLAAGGVVGLCLLALTCGVGLRTARGQTTNQVIVDFQILDKQTEVLAGKDPARFQAEVNEELTGLFAHYVGCWSYVTARQASPYLCPRLLVSVSRPGNHALVRIDLFENQNKRDPEPTKWHAEFLDHVPRSQLKNEIKRAVSTILVAIHESARNHIKPGYPLGWKTDHVRPVPAASVERARAQTFFEYAKYARDLAYSNFVVFARDAQGDLVILHSQGVPSKKRDAQLVVRHTHYGGMPLKGPDLIPISMLNLGRILLLDYRRVGNYPGPEDSYDETTGEAEASVFPAAGG